MAYAANANFTTYSSDFIWLYGTYPEIAQTVIEEAKVTCGNMQGFDPRLTSGDL